MTATNRSPVGALLFELDGPELLEEAVAVLEGRSGNSRWPEAAEALRELAASHEDFELVEKELREAEGRHEEAVVEVRKISEELEDVSGGEDLEKWERELREEEEKLREISATHRGRAAAHEREAKNVDRAREAIDSGADDHCPTCHRGFEEEEQVEISDTLRRQAAALRRLAARENEEAEKLGGRGGHREEAARGLGEARALARGQRSPGPRRGPRRREARSPRASQGAQARAKRASRAPWPRRRGFAGPRPLRGAPLSARRSPRRCESGQEHADKTKRAAELSEELEDLAGVSYDPEDHRAKRQEKARLDESRGRAAELERRLASRPEVEAALEDARRLAGKAEKRRATCGERYPPWASTRRRTWRSPRGWRPRKRGRAGCGTRGSTLAVSGRTRTTGSRRPIRSLGGWTRTASWPTGGRPRRPGWTRWTRSSPFFKSLTARARPMLEAEASALVRELTDNRYERMEFDENYRVRLLDRFDDSYAIDRFSGGEADVASLSARVALSKTPPAAARLWGS